VGDAKRQHYIPQFILKEWFLEDEQKKKTIYFFEKESNKYFYRRTETVAYENYLYAYLIDDLFGASEDIRKKFKVDMNLANYDFYDNKGKLIGDTSDDKNNDYIKIVYLTNRTAISEIKCGGKTLTKAERNTVFTKAENWRFNGIEKALSELESDWKKLVEELKNFRELYIQKNGNVDKGTEEQYVISRKEKIIQFLLFQFIRNPKMKESMSEVYNRIFEILGNILRKEDKDKTIDCAFKNSIVMFIKQHAKRYADVPIKIYLLDKNQNIFLPEEAFFVIQDKGSKAKMMYFPMTPKIIISAECNKAKGSRIAIEKLDDSTVDDFNNHIRKNSKKFYANFDANKKYKLNYILSNR
jgi:hypothetical protein